MTLEEFTFLWLLALAAFAVLYVLPSIIAFRRDHPNRWPILAVNICLGGTGLGWAAALVWALHAVHITNDAKGSHGGESGLNVFTNDVRRMRLVEGYEGTHRAARSSLTTAAAVVELERLVRLRAAGHLSEAEFSGLKAAVLQRL